MKIAVYPGSFDPITNGHLDILERATSVFDKIYITVLSNPQKKTIFTAEERIDMIRQVLPQQGNLEVVGYDGLLVDFAGQVEAQAIIRGLRAVSDFDYEFQLALTNRKLSSRVDTVFFMTGEHYSYLSSSLIKQICSFGGDISDFVPVIVEQRLREKFGMGRGRS